MEFNEIIPVAAGVIYESKLRYKKTYLYSYMTQLSDIRHDVNNGVDFFTSQIYLLSEDD